MTQPHDLSYQSPGSGPVQTHLVEAILVTIFCCLPFGIVGIVFAAMAKSSNDSGNYALAAQQASTAHMWNIWGLVIGIAGTVIYIAIMIAFEA